MKLDEGIAAVHLAACLVPTLQALAEALRVNKSVTDVDLSNNNFGDEGLKAGAPQWRQWDAPHRRSQTLSFGSL